MTLYEKSHQLGGQMIHSDYADFKWPMKKFKDYLIFQMEKQQVAVQLSTEATPERIRAEGYDAVIAAVGAEPQMPSVSGAQNQEVHTPLWVYGNQEKLGHHVILVGGSETGTETALYLARCGHQVTILTRRERLATDAQFSHYYSGLMDAIHQQKALRTITQAKTLAVTGQSVTYLGEDGREHTVTGDSVVACGGMKPLQQEAAAFYGSAEAFFAIGDCKQVGNIHTCTRSALAAAAMI